MKFKERDDCYVRSIGGATFQIVKIVHVEEHAEKPFYRVENHLIHSSDESKAISEAFDSDDFSWVDLDSERSVSEYLWAEFEIAVSL